MIAGLILFVILAYWIASFVVVASVLVYAAQALALMAACTVLFLLCRSLWKSREAILEEQAQKRVVGLPRAGFRASVAELFHCISMAKESGQLSSSKFQGMKTFISRQGPTQEATDRVNKYCLTPRKRRLSITKTDIAHLVIILPIAFLVYVYTFQPAKRAAIKSQEERAIARAATAIPDPPREDKGNPIEAFVKSQTYVQGLLKAPRTAKFPDYSRSIAHKIDDSTWVIKSYVDSQNSFGAMLRTHYITKMRYKGDHKWDFLGFSFLDQ